ncbi:MAG: GNAT family N-acetyltransferase [Candidatus Pacebacteria bacterium]|nr:GNAT family N-acetyltransferase [Candidatus Paceibacterota bacterium]MBP9715813.1 GNAT family N-acetyltransferase [Candidatus Paceibacterota bacterium]
MDRLNGDRQTKFDGDFDSFISSVKDAKEGKNLPENYVPQTVYWIVENDKFIGRVSVRHILNDHLLLSGHIGYAVRPSERGKGYGSIALKLALHKAKELGIEKALVTCADGNIASRKIIEKNGGILEDERLAGDGTNMLRFWITTI